MLQCQCLGSKKWSLAQRVTIYNLPETGGEGNGGRDKCNPYLFQLMKGPNQGDSV